MTDWEEGSNSRRVVSWSVWESGSMGVWESGSVECRLRTADWVECRLSRGRTGRRDASQGLKQGSSRLPTPASILAGGGGRRMVERSEDDSHIYSYTSYRIHLCIHIHIQYSYPHT